MSDTTINATNLNDRAYLGSGSQTINASGGSDRIISYADAGEPDPAQTNGADGRVNPAIADGAGDDGITGGQGHDIYEFRALINAKQEVITQHTGPDGRVNWAGVAGENDSVHDHWVEGFGNDVITDYSKADCDQIVIRGHTVEIAEISYGQDENGAFSLIRVISQQGDGGAGGANTQAGAHDEDALGTIKVYGDRITEDDVSVQRDGVVDGIDQLYTADAQFSGADAGVTQQVFTNTDGDKYYGILENQSDVVYAGLGSQEINGGGGRDHIIGYSDGGEPDPAQTDGAEGRVNASVPGEQANDVYSGGQGADSFDIRLVINAKPEIIAKHTRSDGSVNWAGVAGENDNVHDHWVESIGDDVITDFSNQDGDKLKISGHTVEIASITYGEDENGDYSFITLRSQQGDNGGAHDEDLLGTLKVYGDLVSEDDIDLRNNTAGYNQVEEISDGEAVSRANNTAPDNTQIQYGAPNPENIDLEFSGTSHGDKIIAGSGSQTVNGEGGRDRIISYGDAGEPDPAQTDGDEGRVNPAMADGADDDVLTGGDGGDIFEFRALVNARLEIIKAHTRKDGSVDWNGVAGENDNVHDHWVEGFGTDIITDFSKEQGDEILVRGHTVELAGITYGQDEGGEYSLIGIISQQGDGGAGGANTDTGAHDEDSLGFIKVYGDRVNEDDVDVDNGGNVMGVDRLGQADKLADYNGGVQQFGSRTSGEQVITSPDTVKTTDYVAIAEGAQLVEAGAGNDSIYSFSDGGEPDPAQTDGGQGRVNPPVAEGAGDDIISGGQGRDKFTFQLLINAKQEIIDKHTRDDGSVNWAGVAGENDNVHDHWVEGIGNDVITDYSNQDGDKIIIRGHTVEVMSIVQGEDSDGEYSLISLRSQQGDNGGAHDEDLLGTIKVYGDEVSEDDLEVIRDTRGIDLLDEITVTQNESMEEEGELEDLVMIGDDGDDVMQGDDGDDILVGRRGNDDLKGGAGNDDLMGDRGADTLAGEAGNDDLRGGNGRDEISGGAGDDDLRGNRGQDKLAGDEGDDMLRGGRGSDEMSGGAGDDELRGGNGRDVLSGGTGDDDLRGNRGQDTLAGDEGNDLLNGGAGNDAMSGGRGEDVLVSYRGFDIMNGGEDGDSFMFGKNTGGGEIEDFEDGVDLIDLSQSKNVTGFDDIDIDVVSQTQAVISMENATGQSVEITVIGDAAFTLDENDFVF